MYNPPSKLLNILRRGLRLHFLGWENPSNLNGLFDPEDGCTAFPRYVLATCDPIRYAYIILGSTDYRHNLCAKFCSVNLELIFNFCLYRTIFLSEIVFLFKRNSVTLAQFRRMEVSRKFLWPEKKIWWKYGHFFKKPIKTKLFSGVLNMDSDYKV
jgi:hypothetical protein